MFVAPSGLHVTNFTGLVWLRAECRASTDNASSLFDLVSDAAGFYRELSDAQIARLLVRQGLKVARRTVTKYRQLLKLAPVDRRRKVAVPAPGPHGSAMSANA